MTVTEAMWKAKPVIASRVGGIQDQIVDGRDGLLIADPSDLAALAAAMARLLADRQLADRLGAAGRERVHDPVPRRPQPRPVRRAVREPRVPVALGSV